MSGEQAAQSDIGLPKRSCPLCRGHGITYQLRRKPGPGVAVMTTVRMALCQVCDGTGRRPTEDAWSKALHDRFAALIRRHDG